MADANRQKPVVPRRIKAQETRRRLFKAAYSLLKERDYQDITIRDIVTRAQVSIGTFYVYYPSKLDVFYETYQIADDYFENEVAPLLNEGTTEEKLLKFFSYYAIYCSRGSGLKMAKLLYQPDNRCFSRPRDYGLLRVLIRVLSSGFPESGTRGEEESPEEMAEFFMIASRGLVYNWCTMDGGYNLEEAMERYVRRLMRAFGFADGAV